MVTINPPKNRKPAQFKADFLPFTIIQLHSIDLEAIHKQIEKLLRKAPFYFANTPIVIDTQLLTNVSDLDITALCQLLKQLQIIPVGIKGLPEQAKVHAIKNGLFSLSRTTLPQAPWGKPKQSSCSNTVVIEHPIRAGTQVYVKDGDLIAMSSVNTGAECLAKGNIHIYGPLRGRVLAGVNGNMNAHIFCQALDAELIAIAGYYLVKENIIIPKTTKPMIHIYLKEKRLIIEGI